MGKSRYALESKQMPSGRLGMSHLCVGLHHTGCFFFTGPPPKSSKYRKVDIG